MDRNYLTAAELARRSGVSPTTLSRYLSGERARSGPGGRELVALANALGVTPEYLLGSDCIQPRAAESEARPARRA